MATVAYMLEPLLLPVFPARIYHEASVTTQSDTEKKPTTFVRVFFCQKKFSGGNFIIGLSFEPTTSSWLLTQGGWYIA